MIGRLTRLYLSLELPGSGQQGQVSAGVSSQDLLHATGGQQQSRQQLLRVSSDHGVVDPANSQ